MIRTALALIALAATVFLFQELTAERDRHARTLQDLAAERANRLRADQAAEVHRKHLTRMAGEARAAQTLINQLQTMEGRHAPLSPLLRTTADGLFGTGR